MNVTCNRPREYFGVHQLGGDLQEQAPALRKSEIILAQTLKMGVLYFFQSYFRPIKANLR